LLSFLNAYKRFTPQSTYFLYPKKQEKSLFLIATNVLKNIGGTGYLNADPGGTNNHSKPAGWILLLICKIQKPFSTENGFVLGG
jgi:hypothetical protein